MRMREVVDYVLNSPQNTNPVILKRCIESYVDRSKNPLYGYTLDVDIDKETDLLGLTVDDLQKDVFIEDGLFHGTLYHVKDYVGFSGNPEEQTGWYIALHVAYEGADAIKVNGVTLDPDGIHILWFKEPKRAKATIEIIDGEDSITDTIDFSELVFGDYK